jgi:hypothetical protein
LAVEIDLRLGHRRFRLGYAGLCLLEARHGCVGVGAFYSEKRLPLANEVADPGQHAGDVPGEREDHVRQAVGIRFDLAGRDYVANGNHRCLDLLGADLRDLSGGQCDRAWC